MSLTANQKLEYVNSKRHYCPYCGSEDVSGDFVTIDAGSASQNIICNDCDETWTDFYSLTEILER